MSTWKLVDCAEAARAWVLEVLLHEVGGKSLATEANSLHTVDRLGFKGAEVRGKLGNQTCRRGSFLCQSIATIFAPVTQRFT